MDQEQMFSYLNYSNRLRVNATEEERVEWDAALRRTRPDIWRAIQPIRITEVPEEEA
jgi:hypothetical protein